MLALARGLDHSPDPAGLELALATECQEAAGRHHLPHKSSGMLRRVCADRDEKRLLLHQNQVWLNHPMQTPPEAPNLSPFGPAFIRKSVPLVLSSLGC